MASSSLQGQYSGFLSRLFAFITDLLIVSLTDLFVSWLGSELVHQVTGLSVAACPALQTFNLKLLTCHAASWGMTAFVAGFPLVYFPFFWVLTGQTIGDAVAGIRVVRTNGRRITLVNGAARLGGYFLCIVSLGLGFLWILIDDRRQGWHDKLARTCVIYAWEAQQNGRWVQKLNRQLFGRTQY